MGRINVADDEIDNAIEKDSCLKCVCAAIARSQLHVVACSLALLVVHYMPRPFVAQGAGDSSSLSP